jgi:predicted metal-dependent enzyme (double-stranded beta helix superfamily)
VLEALAADARRVVARGLTLAPPPGGRAWLEVADEADVNAWLIVWSPGAATGVHDHGASEGLVRVLRGALVERYWTPELDRERVRRLYAGTTTIFGADHRHDVQNALGEEAVSLHVYAPRLTRMDFYPPSAGDSIVTPGRPASTRSASRSSPSMRDRKSTGTVPRRAISAPLPAGRL